MLNSDPRTINVVGLVVMLFAVMAPFLPFPFPSTPTATSHHNSLHWPQITRAADSFNLGELEIP